MEDVERARPFPLLHRRRTQVTRHSWRQIERRCEEHERVDVRFRSWLGSNGRFECDERAQARADERYRGAGLAATASDTWPIIRVIVSDSNSGRFRSGQANDQPASAALAANAVAFVDRAEDANP